MDNNKHPSDSKNLILAIVISMAILLAFDFFAPKEEFQQSVSDAGKDGANSKIADVKNMLTGNGLPNSPQRVAPQRVGDVSGSNGSYGSAVNGSQATQDKNKRINIHNNVIDGSISTVGGRLDKIVLSQHVEELVEGDGDENISDLAIQAAKPVSLFAPQGQKIHFFDAGWQTLMGDFKSPDGNTVWTKVDGAELAPHSPIKLVYQNTSGQKFIRTFKISSDDYTINITDRVENNSRQAVNISHYSQLHKSEGGDNSGGLANYNPEKSTFYNFLGPLAYLDEVKTEVDYDDLKDDKLIAHNNQKGWIGIGSRYFFAGIIPDKTKSNNFSFKYSNINGRDFYSTIVQTPAMTIAPQSYAEVNYTVYAGPKQAAELEKLNADLEKAVDYGWFQAISNPIHSMLTWFASVLGGNLGVAIILTTVVLKVLLFPLANKSYRSMAVMRKLQPKMTQLKERYGDKEKDKFAKEMMALYREHKVNPMSGCWPMLIQIPIFFAFYKVILISFEFRHAEFIGWITDLSTKDPYFVLPVLMGISMFFQQKLNPPMADPIQQKVMGALPFIFTFMFAVFPSGLVLYWVTNNILSIGQQWAITRQVEEAN